MATPRHTMSPLAATSVATIVAAVSAAAALGTFFAYLFSVRRTDINAARQEALALAEMRGEVIADLEARLESLERRHTASEETRAKRIRELEEQLAKTSAESREQAYQLQRFYAAALADLLVGVQEDLEMAPPNVERALTRIRGLLARERPAV
jgi:DNA anti-recombination protein RmuC